MKKIYLFFIFIGLCVTSFSQIDTTRTATPLDGKGVWIQVDASTFSSRGYVNDSTRGLIKSGGYFIRQLTSDGNWPVEYGGVMSNGTASNNTQRLQSLINRNYTANIVVGSDSLKSYAINGNLDFLGKTLIINTGSQLTSSSNIIISNAIVYLDINYKSFDSTIKFVNSYFVNGISPKNIGSPNNGVGDDSKYIQSANKQAADNNSICYITGKINTLAGRIVLVDSTRMFGVDGHKWMAQTGTQIGFGTDSLTTNNVEVAYLNIEMYGTYSTNVTILNMATKISYSPSQNINIHHNYIKAKRLGYWNLSIKNATNPRVYNNTFDSSRSTTMMFENTVNARAYSNNVLNAGRGGISMLRFNTGFTINDNYVSGFSQFEDLFDGGIDSYGPLNIGGLVYNNKIYTGTATAAGNNTHIGIRFLGAINTTISNNLIVSDGTHLNNAIAITESQDTLTEGNKVINNQIVLNGTYRRLFNIRGTKDLVADGNEITINPSATADSEPYLLYVAAHANLDTVNTITMRNTKIRAGGKVLYLYGNSTPVRYLDFSGTTIDSLNSALHPSPPNTAYDSLAVFTWIGGYVRCLNTGNFIFRVQPKNGIFRLFGVDTQKPASNLSFLFKLSTSNALILTDKNTINGVLAPTWDGGAYLSSISSVATPVTVGDTVAVFYGARTSSDQIVTLPTGSIRTSNYKTISNISGTSFNILMQNVIGSDTVKDGQSRTYHYNGTVWREVWNNVASTSGSGSVTLTGAVTGTGIGTISTTIPNNSITYTQFQQMVATSVLGRSANSTGNVAAISAASDGHTLRRSGGVLGFGLLPWASLSDVPNYYFTNPNLPDTNLVKKNDSTFLIKATRAPDTSVVKHTDTTVFFKLQANAYSPSRSDPTNVASSSVESFFFERNGKVVGFSGTLRVTPTSASPATTALDLALPLSPTFTATTDLGASGSVTTPAVTGNSWVFLINGRTSNGTARVSFTSTGNTEHVIFITGRFELK